MGYLTAIPQNLDPLCPRVQKIFTLFANHPCELQHLLLYGPPGAGKTSTVEWLLHKIWGDSHMKVQTCRTLNAADERSLDAIRAKIIPFVNTDWRDPADKRPRFLVLDECETLTESAQLALRPFLDNSPQDLCIIFICNSLSRVQMSLRSRCLRIRFDPPITNSLQTQSMRGDLRGARIMRNDITHWLAYMHAPSNCKLEDIPLSHTELIQAALFFLTSFDMMDSRTIEIIAPLLKLGIDALPVECIEIYMRELKKECLRKFETLDWRGIKVTSPSTQHKQHATSHKPSNRRATAATPKCSNV